jgi:phosphoribosylaminoimidazole-succinocarboxamide synthase
VLGVEDGFKTENTVIDMQYNNDELGDPFINEHHAVALGLASYDEVGRMLDITRKAGDLLEAFLHRCGIELVDMKLEFGRDSDDGSLIISDEISPDTCRLWDSATGKKLDKDRFRRDLGGVEDAYAEVMRRLCEHDE